MTQSRILRTAGSVVTAGLVLAAIVAPSATLASRGPDHAVASCHATDCDSNGETPTDAPQTDAAPTDETAADAPPAAELPVAPIASEAPSQPGDPSIPGDGEVSIDGPFLTPTPEGTVLGATGVPGLTPPPTDATAHGASTAGGGLQLLLLALAGLSSVVLIVGRVPAARRS